MAPRLQTIAETRSKLCDHRLGFWFVNVDFAKLTDAVCALQNLQARMQAFLRCTPTSEQEYLGAMIGVRIWLEKFLRQLCIGLLGHATTLEFVPTPDKRRRDGKKFFDPQSASLSELAQYLHRQFDPSVPPVLKPLFGTLQTGRLVHQVTSALNDVVHGRKATFSATGQLNALHTLLSELLDTVPRQEQFVSPLPGLTIVERVSVEPTIERYRVRAHDSSRSFALWAYRDRLTTDGQAKAFALAVERARRLHQLRGDRFLAVHQSGVTDGRAWFITDEIANETLAELTHASSARSLSMTDAKTIVATLGDALTAAHAQHLSATERGLRPEQVFFADSTATLLAQFAGGRGQARPHRLAPMLLGAGLVGDAIASREPPATVHTPPTTKQLEIQSLGTVMQYALTGVATTDPSHPSIRAISREAAEWIEQTKRVSAHTEASQVALGLQQLPERGFLRWWTIVVPAAAALAAVALVALWQLRGDGKATETSAPAGDRTQSSPSDGYRRTRRFAVSTEVDPTSPLAVLLQWERSIDNPDSPSSFRGIYARRSKIMGVLFTDSSIGGDLRSAWSERIAHGGYFEVTGELSMHQEHPEALRGSARACLSQDNPTGRILRLSINARWRDPQHSEHVPCEIIAGPYFWRMRVEPEGWRICHESWEGRDALCRSCPSAAPCRAGEFAQ